jgi:flagellar biosynthesis protein FlhA
MANAVAVRGSAQGARSAPRGTGVSPLNRLVVGFQKYRNLLLPAAFIAMIMVIIIPIPTFLLDILLAANLTLAAIILVSVLFAQSPLELSIFPALLLGSTLFRLVLNVASTRLILTAGDRFSNPTDAKLAAGHVINTFAGFVAGGSLVIGIIIFTIMIVIQFVVITKGATRIAEVAARFTLDAMPGKQMAIDADLNAGMIKEDEARKRRKDIAREAEFYGAMDGAAKFVRGDAIAGIMIVFVNVLGGVAIGMLQYGWSIVDCFGTFTRLTIGDGLVSQIPAFIISLAAGLLTTRSTSQGDMGEEFIQQLTSKKPALIITAMFLFVLSLTGLPLIPMWILAACCGGIAWTMTKREKKAAADVVKQQKATATAEKKKPEKIESLLSVDTMELEVGYGLVQLVDAAKGGDLLDRISLIRRQVAIELGIVVPPIRIRDNMELAANDYRIKLRGNPLATGSVLAGQYLAIDSGTATGKINGISTKEPAFGLPAWWINDSQRGQAEMLNYTVVEASGVLATHITEVVKSHAYELLTREDVTTIIKQLKEKAPSLVDEVIPSQVKPGELQRVLQNLLRERVPIKDMETILETLSEWAPKTRDPDVLSEAVRHNLARTICQQFRDDANTIHVITMDPVAEDTINGYIERNERGSFLTLPPQLARTITENIAKQINKLVTQGHSGIVLCSPQVRGFIRKMIEPTLPTVAVLSYSEIVKGINVESVGIAGAAA